MSQEMTQEKNVAALQHEARWLRRWWWAVSLVLSGAAFYWIRYDWCWIALDPSLVAPERWPSAGVSAGIVAVSFVGIPLLWWLGLRAEQRWPSLACRFPLAPTLALVSLLGAESIMRTSPAQAALWQAIRSRVRAGGEDFFLKEVALLRLDRLWEQPSRNPKTVVVTGSSQVLHGLDCDVLRAALPSWTIKRRALAGMTPLKLTMMSDDLSLEPGCLLLMYLSENELIEGHLVPDWNRPSMSLAGLRRGWACFSARRRLRDWRAWADLGVASGMDLWRVRDYVRHVVLHPLGPKPAAPRTATIAEVGAVLDSPYRSPKQREEGLAANLRAMDQLHALIRDAGARIVIFEGQSRPDDYTTERHTFREEVRAALSTWAANHGAVYVAAAEQPLHFHPQDWLDPVHLNGSGRGKFTAYVGEWLSRNAWR